MYKVDFTKKKKKKKRISENKDFKQDIKQKK